MDIKSEIIALLDSLNCEHTEENGIIKVTTPEGKVWDFTTPQEVQSQN